jgi:two-component system CheB/CheR fusion protein
VQAASRSLSRAQFLASAGQSCPATDAAPEILARASRGLFSRAAVETIPLDRRERFFYAVDGAYRVKRSLREKMVFASQDLLADPPITGLDLVTCRNLLIYLQPDAVKCVLYLLHSSLRMGGCLFLGLGEALPPNQEGFEAVSSRWRIYRKVGPVTGIAVAFPRRLKSGQHPTVVTANAHRAAVEHFNLPSVLIDDQFRILRIYGEMDTFLRLPAGEPTLNLLDLAIGLGSEMKSAVAQVLSEGKSLTVNGLWDSGKDDYSLSLRVTPLKMSEPGGTPRLLVSFIRDAAQGVDGNGDGGLRSHSNSGDIETRAWSEAVRISREELDASREELQALNEELKASNEQLNVANEDLNLANAKLQEKIAELEMQSAVLSSGGVKTLFLDEELRVRWFTPGVTALFPLIPRDAGRRITDLVPNFEDQNFISDARAVMQTREGVESEVCNLEGRWFLRRIRPYLSRAGTATGVAVTFTDITARKRAEAELQAHTEELERFNKVAVGRELWMIELKKEINELRRQRGEPARYPLKFEAKDNDAYAK